MTSQKDLECAPLKKELDRMVNFEKEVNRNEDEKEEDTNNIIQITGKYLFGFVLGYSVAKIFLYINGRGKDNQR